MISYLRALHRQMAGFDSAAYWQSRYQAGGTSGRGSYGELAHFKADILNKVVEREMVNTVGEFGCGDGAQLALATYPKYVGFDVAASAVSLCTTKYSGDTTKQFRHLTSLNASERFDMTLSLDVIYHLIEDKVFYAHVHTVFTHALRLVVIYSSNHDDHSCRHVRHREFTSHIECTKPNWALLEIIKNPYPRTSDTDAGSFANFYIYGRRAADQCTTIE